MMNIDENTLGIWYVQTLKTQDFLGMLARNADNSGFTFTYRFRYYNDTKNFDSDDEKSWYTVKIANGYGDPLQIVKGIVNKLATLAQVTATELLMDEGGVNGLVGRLMVQPFAHAKLSRIEEA